MIAKDRAMVRDVVISLIETNRTIYRQKDKSFRSWWKRRRATRGGQLRL